VRRMLIQIKDEHLKSVYHNIPRIFFDLFQAQSLKEKYLFFYFNVPYLFPTEKFPAKITIEFNNYCNFQCTHCHRYVVNENRLEGELDFDLFKNIITELSKHPATILKIGGWGEPVLHPKFKEMMVYCSERNVRTYLFTNGTIFKKFTSTELMNFSSTILVISMDGFDQESYEKIRVGGNYHELRKEIEEFYHYRNMKKKYFPKIVVQRVVFPHEKYKEIEQFRKYWILRTDVVDFCVFNPIEKILAKSANNRSIRRCKRIRRELSIMYDGKVPVCGPQTKYSDCEYVGDVNRDSIYDIWNSPRMIKVRDLLAKKNFDMLPKCMNCIYFR
jgi:MoaA/NifB/PqqE/SkfB family radical SAM enzyme